MSRFEIIISNAVFFLVMAAPLIAGTLLVLTVARRRSRTSARVVWCSVALLAALAFNPLFQYLVLEPYDQQRGLALAAHASSASLLGMAATDARGLFGEPSYVWQLDSDTTCWGYKQLPGYWLGSHFQVFLEDQAVVGFEANDD